MELATLDRLARSVGLQVVLRSRICPSEEQCRNCVKTPAALMSGTKRAAAAERVMHEMRKD